MSFLWLPTTDAAGCILEVLWLLPDPEPAGLPKLTQLEVFSCERFNDFWPLPLLLLSFCVVLGLSIPDILASPFPLLSLVLLLLFLWRPRVGGSKNSLAVQPFVVCGILDDKSATFVISGIASSTVLRRLES